MLPIVDKPAIQYVIEDAVEAGLTDVLMITGRNKNALENHFDRAWELETTLVSKGDISRLQKVTHSTDLAQIHYVRQGDALGLGHAVAKARGAKVHIVVPQRGEKRHGGSPVHGPPAVASRSHVWASKGTLPRKRTFSTVADATR